MESSHMCVYAAPQLYTDIQTCQANQTVRVRARACAVWAVTSGCLQQGIPVHQGAPSGKVTAAGD